MNNDLVNMGKIRKVIYLIAVLSFLISLFWVCHQPDYEPALALLSSIGAIIALLTSDDLKDYHYFSQQINQQPQIASIITTIRQKILQKTLLQSIGNWLHERLRQFQYLIWIVTSTLAIVFLARAVYTASDIWMKWKARQVFVGEFWASRFSRCSDGLWRSQINSQIESKRVQGFLVVSADPSEFQIETFQLSDTDRQNGFNWGAYIFLNPASSKLYCMQSDKLAEAEQAVDNKSSYVYKEKEDMNPLGQNFEYRVVLEINHNKSSGWNIVIPNKWYRPDMEAIIQNIMLNGSKAPQCENVPNFQ